ncbi:ribosomal protein S15 [Necator americanus]|uniref:Ribosomal protein S15 n=1 Tax=Necator americanus TaxID=51031 RepID=W2TWY9_NECAM|nr:ribosomal protein S15 [Necator americanus]ETN85586.1 ribosomal protein S15 [Necator americanus]
MTEKRRRHHLNAVYETGEELFLGTCDSRGVGGVGVLVNTSMAKNFDSFEQLMTRIGTKAAKFRGRNPRTIINWDLFATLAGFWEDSATDNVDEEYDRLVEHLHDCAKKAESSKTTKRRLSLESLELIRQRGAARAAGNQELTSVLAKLCREAMKEDLIERRAEQRSIVINITIEPSLIAVGPSHIAFATNNRVWMYDVHQLGKHVQTSQLRKATVNDVKLNDEYICVVMEGKARLHRGMAPEKYRLILVESRIHRLARYYKTSRQLPATWKYESATAASLIS